MKTASRPNQQKITAIYYKTSIKTVQQAVDTLSRLGQQWLGTISLMQTKVGTAASGLAVDLRALECELVACGHARPRYL